MDVEDRNCIYMISLHRTRNFLEVGKLKCCWNCSNWSHWFLKQRTYYRLYGLQQSDSVWEMLVQILSTWGDCSRSWGHCPVWKRRERGHTERTWVGRICTQRTQQYSVQLGGRDSSRSGRWVLEKASSLCVQVGRAVLASLSLCCPYPGHLPSRLGMLGAEGKLGGKSGAQLNPWQHCSPTPFSTLTSPSSPS